MIERPEEKEVEVQGIYEERFFSSLQGPSKDLESLVYIDAKEVFRVV
jgi:hypothetical protein